MLATVEMIILASRAHLKRFQTLNVKAMYQRALENIPTSSSSASIMSAQQIEYTISERKPSGRPKITEVSTGLPRHISFSERFVSK